MTAPATEGLVTLRDAAGSGVTGRIPGVPRPRSRRGWLAVAVVALAWSAWDAGVGRAAVVNTGGWPVAQRFVAGALHPDLAPEFLRSVVTATAVTAAFAVLGTALSVVIGVLGGFVLSRSWWRGTRLRARLPLGWLAVRGVAALPRGLHEAVWGLLLINVLGRDPLVGVLAIGLPYGAVTAKVYADLIDEAPRAPHTALVAAGAGRLRAYAYGLAPNTFVDMVSYGLYRFDCSLRSAVILGIIGAGGLGFLLETAFADLSYGRMWTTIYVLVILCGAADVAGHRLRRRLGASREFSCWRLGPDGAGVAAPVRDRVFTSAVVAAAVAVGWSWLYLRVDVRSLWSSGAREQVAFVVAQAWPPTHGTTALRELGRLSVQTLQMSLLAVTIAASVAMAVAPIAARPIQARSGAARRVAGATCRGGLLLARSVPPPVWALVLLFLMLPGPLPGALALAVYNVGVLGRLMAEAVENLDRGPAQALQGQGAGAVAAFGYAVLPRAVPRFLAYALYRWEVTVRDTVIVGLVGAGGLGYLLSRQVAAFDWRGAVSTLTALVLLTFLVDLISVAIRRSLR